jgi:ketosteroid isomerase-like protein
VTSDTDVGRDDAALHNRQIIADYLDAWVQEDAEKGVSYYADDMVVRIAGRSPISGTYCGKEEFRRSYIDKYFEITSGRPFVVSIEDILCSQERVMALVKERFENERKGVLETCLIVVYKIKDDKITEMSAYHEDQYAVDEFFSALLAE